MYPDKREGYSFIHPIHSEPAGVKVLPVATEAYHIYQHTLFAFLASTGNREPFAILLTVLSKTDKLSLLAMGLNICIEQGSVP
jgi:hypothetical protein